MWQRVTNSKTKLDHQKNVTLVPGRESFISRIHVKQGKNTEAAWAKKTRDVKKVLSPYVSCASQASHAAVIHVVIQHDHLTCLWLRLQQGAHISCNPWISKQEDNQVPKIFSQLVVNGIVDFTCEVIKSVHSSQSMVTFLQLEPLYLWIIMLFLHLFGISKAPFCWSLIFGDLNNFSFG